MSTQTTFAETEGRVLREYDVSGRGVMKQVYNITLNGESTPRYTIKLKGLFRRGCDVTLHEGEPDKTPAICGAKLPTLTHSGFRLARGDPNSPNATFENLKTYSKLSISHYGTSLRTESGEMREFEWKGTNTGDGGSRSSNNWNLKVVDSKTGAVVARYNHRKSSLALSGSVQVFEDVGIADMDQILITSFLAIAEQAQIVAVAVVS
jgi:hypothetical protein